MSPTFGQLVGALRDEWQELQALLIANGVRPLPVWSIRAARAEAHRRGLIPKEAPNG